MLICTFNSILLFCVFLRNFGFSYFIYFFVSHGLQKTILNNNLIYFSFFFIIRCSNNMFSMMLHQCVKTRGSLIGNTPYPSHIQPICQNPTLKHHNFCMPGQISEINVAADFYNIYNL